MRPRWIEDDVDQYKEIITRIRRLELSPGITADPNSPPLGPAGGVLAGSYPNPSFAQDMATQVELNTHANLGVSAHGGIVADTDPRLTNSRAPTGAASGDLTGNYPGPTIKNDVILNGAARIKGLNGQTNDLLQGRLFDDTTVFRVRIDGTIDLRSNGALTDNAYMTVNGGRARFGYESQTVMVDDGGTSKTIRLRSGATGTGVIIAPDTSLAGTTQTSLLVRAAPSQTSDIQSWQDSTTAYVARMSAAGALSVSNLSVTGTGLISTANGGVYINRSAGSNPGLNFTVAGDAGPRLMVNMAGEHYWGDGTVGSTYDTVLLRDSAGVLRLQGQTPATRSGFVIRGTSAQSGNDFQQWQDNTNAVLARMDSGGRLTSIGVTSNASIINTMAAASNIGFRMAASGDADSRFQIRADGMMYWNSGASGAHDVTLQRSGAGQLILQGQGAAVSSRLYVKGVGTQTDDLIQLQNPSGTPVINLRADGGMTTTGYLNATGSISSTAGQVRAPNLADFRASTTLVNNYIGSTTVDAVSHSPVPAVLWHDLFAFGRKATPTFETTADGGSNWSAPVTADLAPFAQLEDVTYQAFNGTTANGARWTWFSTDFAFCGGKWLVLATGYAGATVPIRDIKIEAGGTDGLTWTTIGQFNSQSFNNDVRWLHMPEQGNVHYYRLTITHQNAVPLNVTSLRWLSNRWGDQGGGKEDSYPYRWNKNAQMAIGASAQPALAQDASLTLRPNTVNSAALLIRGLTSQVTDPFRVDDSAGNNLMSLNASGSLTIGTTNVLANRDISILGPSATQNLLLQTRGTYNALVSTGTELALTASTNIFWQNNGVETLRMVQSGQLRLPITGVNGGLLIGGDTNLYRGAADLLRTDDQFVVGRATGTDTAYVAFVAGEANNRFQMNASGLMTWGAGGASAVDTNLYRQTANTLATDDEFKVLRTTANSDVAFSTLASTDGTPRWLMRADGFMAWGDGTAARDVNLYRLAADKLRTDDRFEAGGGIRSESNFQIVRVASTDTAMDFSSSGDTVSRLFMRMDGLMEWGSGAAPRDTNLYRAGVDTLRSDDRISSARAAATDLAFTAHVTADTDQRWRVSAAGVMEWGTGSATQDVNLYRSTINLLKTDDDFQALSLSTTGTVKSRATSRGEVILGGDANGSIEIGSNANDPGAQTPFIDWHYAPAGTWTGQDYNFRIMNAADGVLRFTSQQSGVSSSQPLELSRTQVKFGSNFTFDMNASTATFPNNSLSGAALADNSILASKIGFIYGGGNMAYNSSFEAGFADGDPSTGSINAYDGWIVIGSPAISVVTAATDPSRIWGIGNNAVKLVSTVAGQYIGLAQSTSPNRMMPVQEGQTYTMSAYLGTNTASRTGYMEVSFRDSAGVQVGSLVAGPTIPLSTTQMSRPQLVYTVPTGTGVRQVQGRVVVTGTPVAVGEIFYVDGFQNELGAAPTAYSPRSDEILPGSITATMLQAGAVYADAITANFTITGKRIQTDVSPNARVVLEGADDSPSVGDKRGLKIFDAANVKRIDLEGTNGLRIFNSSGVMGLQSSAGGLVTGTGTNRAELLGDGLTLYESSTARIKLDVATGQLQFNPAQNQRMIADYQGIKGYDNKSGGGSYQALSLGMSQITFTEDPAIGLNYSTFNSRTIMFRNSLGTQFFDVAVSGVTGQGLVTVGPPTGSSKVVLRGEGKAEFYDSGSTVPGITAPGMAIDAAKLYAGAPGVDSNRLELDKTGIVGFTNYSDQIWSMGGNKGLEINAKAISGYGDPTDPRAITWRNSSSTYPLAMVQGFQASTYSNYNALSARSVVPLGSGIAGSISYFGSDFSDNVSAVTHPKSEAFFKTETRDLFSRTWQENTVYTSDSPSAGTAFASEVVPSGTQTTLYWHTFYNALLRQVDFTIGTTASFVGLKATVVNGSNTYNRVLLDDSGDSHFLPKVVTVLPGSPFHGQEIRYQDSGGVLAAQGVVWTFKYNANSSSTYKWEFVGGPPLTTNDETDRAYTSTGVWNGSPAGNTLQLTTPIAGDWDLEFEVSSYTLNAPVAGQIGAGIGIGASNPATFNAEALAYTPGNVTVTATGFGRFTGYASGTIFRHYCLGPASTDVHPRGRAIKMTPVRIG